MNTLGIDIGGSGIKCAIVDTDNGALTSFKLRVETPRKVNEVLAKVNELIKSLNWAGTFGCAFPALVQNGIVHTATNIDKAWIGKNVEVLLYQATSNPCVVLNDADAAGIAEITFGCGMGVKGTVIMLTIGTGIGSAIFSNGSLLTNTELGHIKFKGKIAEAYASDAARKKHGLSWAVWGSRLNEYLLYLEKLFSPELFIIGGGGSRKFDKFSPRLTVKTPTVPALLLNDAGLVGAALSASLSKSLTV